MKDLSKVLFMSDLDGTLLPHSKILNPKDLEAIEKFRALGGTFSIATGRVLHSATRYFEPLNLDFSTILGNGSAIYNVQKSEFVWQEFLDSSICDFSAKIFEKFPHLGGEINRNDAIYVPFYSDAERQHLEVSYDNKFIEATFDKIPKSDWIKVLFAAKPAQIVELKNYFEDLQNNNQCMEYDCVRSSNHFYEILPKNCSKGSALEKYVEMYGLSDWTIVACGDFNNDLTMLEYADIAISPLNAQDEVKAISDYVTSVDCDNGAIAEAIEYVINKL